MSVFSKLKEIKDLRSKAKTVQSVLETITTDESSGGVAMTMNGNQQLTKVNLDSSSLEDKANLEEKIVKVHNDLVTKVQRKAAMKMKEMGELDIPGLS